MLRTTRAEGRPIKPWQFDVMFVVMIVGAIALMLAKPLGFSIDPAALTGYGAITTYVLTQRASWTKDKKELPKDATDA